MKKLLNVKHKISALMLVVLILVFNSCNEDAIEGPGDNSRIRISNNISDLNSRVRIPQYDEALSVNDVALPLINGRQGNVVNNHSTYELILRAEVASPEVNGKKLQASHVFIEGDLAFVSYNTEGPEYRGGVEVFDISNIKAPSLIYQMIVEGTEYSSIYFENGKIYLAGATEQTEDLTLNSTAILEIVDYPVSLEKKSQILDIASFTATDVKVHGDFIYVTSGSHGGLTIFNKHSLEKVTDIGMDDARSIAFNDEIFAIMQGTPARVKVYRISDHSYVKGFNIGGADIPESKSILNISQNKIYVPAGREGLKVIALQDGQLLAHMALPGMEEVAEEMIVTNGVSVNAEKIFCANGAAGMYLSEQQTEQASLIGSVNFQASTNYVESRGNVMFVATGLGGLKIIEIVEHAPEEEDFDQIGEWDDHGTPQYLCEKATPVSQELKDLIRNNFVPTKNLIKHKPQYFGADKVSDLVLKEDTDLKVTFYSETAGWKNTLGYYIYDRDNPPATADDLEKMTIIYPNTSQKGSGGYLVQGDKVCLTDLKAGSVVGFFLISQGWNDGKVTSGVYTNYTTQNLNTEWPSDHRQAGLLLDAGAENTIILSFEDTQLPGGDKDFDDVLYLLEPTNPESIDFIKLTPLE